MRFAGRTCLVTGAAAGIGAATVELLADQGATVAAADVDSTGLDKVRGARRDQGDR
ncbi:MAG TPA: SDR family NAD(P)-dependent oxidoreductase [Pseudonocardiaceae bacterium]